LVALFRSTSSAGAVAFGAGLEAAGALLAGAVCPKVREVAHKKNKLSSAAAEKTRFFMIDFLLDSLFKFEWFNGRTRGSLYLRYRRARSHSCQPFRIGSTE
jgi:hypothetical protein